MKLLKRKTRKAIEKRVRKALKKHGPALLAAAASTLVSSLATLAGTDAAGKPGKSKLTELVDRAKESVATRVPDKDRSRKGRRKSGRQASDSEDAPLGDKAVPQPQLN